MRSLKRLFERYFDLPDVRPGEDTAWSFSDDWPAWAPEWVLILAIPLAIIAVYAIYHRDAKRAGWKTRLGLITLRLGQIALLLVFLSNVTLSVDGTELPAVVVLVDRSASMQLDDAYSEKAINAKAAELLKETGMTKPSRLNLAKALMIHQEGRFLKDLQRYHRLYIYDFAADARRFQSGEFFGERDVDKALSVLKAELQPDGMTTNHRGSLKRIFDDFSGSPPAAVVLLTDGITTSGEADRLSQAAALADKHSVQIFVVALGSTDPARDLQLSGILAPDVAFVNDPITFSADLRAFGAGDKPVTLRLKHKGRSEVLASRVLPAPKPGVTQRVELVYTPTKKAENVEFQLEVAPLRQETNTANNVQTTRVSIRGETLKVLLADSGPRYEFRYLKHLLEREQTVELHTILQESDLEYAAQDATAKPLQGRFPIDRERLLKYDAIILGDVDLSIVPDDVVDNLAAFVRNGGNMVMIAGLYHNPLTYTRKSLKGLLPFDLDDVKPPVEDVEVDTGFRAVRTAAARGNSMFRLTAAGRSDEAVWKQLPELHWLLELGELKPGAQVFLEHPIRQTRPAGVDAARRPLPVILMHRVGAGKVLYHTTDELWRWRRLVGDLYYGRYWIQSLRALCRSKLVGKSREAELESDRRRYAGHQTVRLSLRFFDEKRLPDERDGATVVIEKLGAEVARLKLRRVPHLPNVLSGEIPNESIPRLTDGSYRAWVVAPFFKDGTPSTNFTIEPPQRELQLRDLATNELKSIADKSGGEYFNLATANNLPDRIPRGMATPLNEPTSIPLWNRWELMLLFALLIAVEWVLRKRLRLV